MVLNDTIRGVVSNEDTFWSRLVKNIPNCVGLDTSKLDNAQLKKKIEELNTSLIVQNANLGKIAPQIKTISFLQDPLLAIRKHLQPLHLRIRARVRGRGTISDSIQMQMDSLEKSVRVTNSNYMANLYGKAGSFKVIPMGVDHELFKPMDKNEMRKKYSIPSDRPVNIFVGSQHPVKGFDKIQKMITEGSAFWILVLKDAPLDSGHKHTTFFRVTQDILAELYNCADLCVARSITESFGLSVVEAMLCDIPVDATKTGIFWDWHPEFKKPREEALQYGLDKDTWMKNWTSFIQAEMKPMK